MAARVIELRWKELIESFAPGMSAHIFLAVMRETSTTLVGAAAVEFAQWAPDWRLRDVDFICGRGGFENFCIFLIEKLHGVAINPEEHDAVDAKYLPRQAKGVVDRCIILTKDAIFDVMCSGTLTPLTALTQSYSTHLMTSVSADAICIPYPSTFFDQIGVLRNGERSNSVQQGITKWTGRGFRLVDKVADIPHRKPGGPCESGGYCPKATRYFGDDDCLTFCFDKASTRAKGGDANSQGGPKSYWTAGWIFGGDACACETCAWEAPGVYESAWIIGVTPIV